MFPEQLCLLTFVPLPKLFPLPESLIFVPSKIPLTLRSHSKIFSLEFLGSPKKSLTLICYSTGHAFFMYIQPGKIMRASRAGLNLLYLNDVRVSSAQHRARYLGAGAQQNLVEGVDKGIKVRKHIGIIYLFGGSPSGFRSDSQFQSIVTQKYIKTEVLGRKPVVLERDQKKQSMYNPWHCYV